MFNTIGSTKVVCVEPQGSMSAEKNAGVYEIEIGVHVMEYQKNFF